VFLDAIIRDWGNRSDTPEFRRRIENARRGWVSQKTRPLAALAASGSLSEEDLASQLLALDQLSRQMVARALERRPQADPLKGVGIGRLPRKAEDSQ
jgi:hypothetical protein